MSLCVIAEIWVTSEVGNRSPSPEYFPLLLCGILRTEGLSA